MALTEPPPTPLQVDAPVSALQTQSRNPWKDSAGCSQVPRDILVSQPFTKLLKEAPIQGTIGDTTTLDTIEMSATGEGRETHSAMQIALCETYFLLEVRDKKKKKKKSLGNNSQEIWSGKAGLALAPSGHFL